jgi:hypothetical protein
MGLIEKGQPIEHVSGSLDKSDIYLIEKAFLLNKVFKIKHFAFRI